MPESFFFAWEGAEHPEGPFRHLDVLEFHGKEAMSALYWFTIDLVRRDGAPDIRQFAPAPCRHKPGLDQRLVLVAR